VTTVHIAARDPLIFRDGRPNDGRSESRTLEFPAPSVLAGVVRTVLGRTGGAFNKELISSLLKQVSLRGPLLLSRNGLFVPAPSDALLFKREDGKLRVRALHPIMLPEGASCSPISELLPVGLRADENDRAKPHDEAPRLWVWGDMEAWLQNPKTLSLGGSEDHAEADRLARGVCQRGVVALPREERVHVALGPLGTAEDGKLFSAEGLRLFPRASLNPQEKIPEELSFLIEVEIGDATLGPLTSGIRPLGGERRLSSWCVEAESRLPVVPDWLLKHVREQTEPVLRVVLLTPAYVSNSLKPSCLQTDGVKVLAAKVDRPRTLSGWNMAKNLPHGEPKKSRRFAAAGSVYWVQLSGDEESRVRWVKERWMQNLGDDVDDSVDDRDGGQLRRDGFGLAVIGIEEAS
jgi:CRISPR-associated protein Cmr3